MVESGRPLLNESDWRRCDDPDRMLECLRGTVSERTLRLFAVACCRRLGDLLAHPASLDDLRIAEGFATGDVDQQALSRRSSNNAIDAAWGAAWDGPAWMAPNGPAWLVRADQAARGSVAVPFDPGEVAQAAAEARAWAAGAPHVAAKDYVAWKSALQGTLQQERLAQCELLRGLVGYPFN